MDTLADALAAGRRFRVVRPGARIVGYPPGRDATAVELDEGTLIEARGFNTRVGRFGSFTFTTLPPDHPRLRWGRFEPSLERGLPRAGYLKAEP